MAILVSTFLHNALRHTCEGRYLPRLNMLVDTAAISMNVAPFNLCEIPAFADMTCMDANLCKKIKTAHPASIFLHLSILIYLQIMSQKPFLHTVLSPKLLNLYDVANSVAVIIDVFRATSTIATALYNGADKIIPVASVEDCINIGKNLRAITAGERDGKVIPGLQYGNSPAEYPREFIEGKTLVLTTTNGTKLLHMALTNGADEVITGSFPNLDAVCDFLIKKNKNVILGCSAWKDKFNLEDTLFAGAVIGKVKEHFIIHCDSSLIAEDMYTVHKNDMYSLIRKTTHWHRLSAYGLEKDLEYCVTENVANVLPLYRNGALIAG